MGRRRGSSRGESRGPSVLGLLFSKPVLFFFLLAVAVGLVVVYRRQLDTYWTSLYILFGTGLIVLGIWLLTFLVIFVGKRFFLFYRYWNIWLGAIGFSLVALGILAFFRRGGSFGLSVIESEDAVGVLRLLALFIVGSLFAFPRKTLMAFRLFSIGLWKFLRAFWRLASMLAGVVVGWLTREKPPEAAAKESPALVPIVKEVVPPPARQAAPLRREMQQVTKDVWKKYAEAQPKPGVSGWQLPSLDILDRVVEVEIGEEENRRRARIIEDALNSYNVDAKVVQINVGPTVTQFGIEPGWDRKYKELKEKDRDGVIRTRLEEVSKTRVKVERITSLSNDLALALAAPSLRIEAPVPGKSVVGVEVPNSTFGLVSLRSVIESPGFQKIKSRTGLCVALGKGAGGEAASADLTKMPHLLIAGATNSGKTVCLNAVISCLLLYNSPDDLRFVMVDPKRVEMTAYNGIPHLVTPVIVENDKAVNALRWLLQEMDSRYKRFASAGARNIETYNKGAPVDRKMPFLVLVIDELADLMMTAFEEVEHNLCRLAQMARATGIHLVVATQRPSVDVVTGLIKANFPTRISFAVTSQVDSRTILDTVGAEKLLGRGDMLYMPTDASKPKRLQGCFLSDPEIERIVHFWTSQRKLEAGAETEAATATQGLEQVLSASLKRPAETEDPMLEEARKLARDHAQVSASFLQRRLRIGYPRAARIMEMLEAEKGAGQGGQGGGQSGQSGHTDAVEGQEKQ